MEFTPAENINLSKFDIYSTNVEYIVSDDQVVAILMDSREKYMLLLDGKGELIAKCGRKGQGPKEFQSPDAVWWDAQQQAFAVYDSDNGHISMWNGEGQYLSTKTVEHRLKNPNLHQKQTLFYTKNERGILEGMIALVKIDLESGATETFWSVGEGRYEPPKVKISNAVMVASTDWDPRLTYNLGSDFIVLSYTRNDLVKIYELDGTFRKNITPAFKRYEVTEQEIDDQINASFSIARPTLRAKRQELYTGKSWPRVRRILVDGKDRIWIIGQPNRNDGSFPIQIFNRQGQHQNETALPFEPSFIVEDRVYGLKESGDDIYLQSLIFSF